MKVKVRSAIKGIWYENLIGKILNVDPPTDNDSLYRLFGNGPLYIYDNEYREHTDNLGMHKYDIEIIPTIAITDCVIKIKNSKKELAEQIRKLVEEFNKETGINVKYIDLNYLTFTNDNVNVTVHAKLRDVNITLENI